MRANFKGDLKIKMKFATKIESLYDTSYSNGYIYLNLWRTSSVRITAGGFSGPTANMVCRIDTDTTNYPC